ncbi:MAG: hypothetical protein H7X97_11460 [Opitutaceae bacterium]|nr:hypothetical protein [Verrucomicrobiales bacterium]
MITIIGVLAAIGLPKLSGFSETSKMTAASRQLMDDLQLARQRAINSRSTVYVLFVPPTLANNQVFVSGLTNLGDRVLATNLLGGQLTTYALFTRRSVGEQPGKESPRYITPWRSLPDGIYIQIDKFLTGSTNRFNFTDWALNASGGSISKLDVVPFPAEDSDPYPATGPGMDGIPYVAFDSRGQLIGQVDEVIPLTRGSIFYARDGNGNFTFDVPDVQEVPPGNTVSNYNRIRIDWLTGRPKVERPELP